MWNLFRFVVVAGLIAKTWMDTHSVALVLVLGVFAVMLERHELDIDWLHLRALREALKHFADVAIEKKLWFAPVMDSPIASLVNSDGRPKASRRK